MKIANRLFFIVVLLISTNTSVVGQSKRQQKFMVMNISYQSAKAVSLLTMQNFLGINLINIEGSDYDKTYTGIVKKYSKENSGFKYLTDIYFEHDGANLVVKLKNFQYYDKDLRGYTSATLSLTHNLYRSIFRREIIQYVREIIIDRDEFSKAEKLYEDFKSRSVPKPTGDSSQSVLVSEEYKRNGCQFDIKQETFLVGGQVSIIYSQTIAPDAYGQIYIVSSNTPRGKTVDRGNQIISKKYLKASASKLILSLPTKPGIYEIRYALNKYGIIDEEIAYKVIEIKMPKTTIDITKNNYVPGEEIRVRWKSEIKLSTYSSIIAIVPSDVPHSTREEIYNHKMSYEGISNKSDGLATLTAPSDEGNYTIRIGDHKSNIELISIPFTVSYAEVELKLEKKVFNEGEKIKIFFKSSVAPQNEAWIGILENDVPHGNTEENKKHWIDSKSVKNKREAIIYLDAPTISGKYDIRMNYYGEGTSHYFARGGAELASVTIVVNSSGKSEVIEGSDFHYSSLDVISESLSQGQSVINQKVILDNINFSSGSAELTKSSNLKLAEVVSILKQYPNLKSLIVGYTDNIGDEYKNLELSKKRAQAVVVYLIMQGIQPSNLSYEGFGQSIPIADNNTSLGRLKNRRVEFEIIGE